jgi:hypothetical protein
VGPYVQDLLAHPDTPSTTSTCLYRSRAEALPVTVASRTSSVFQPGARSVTAPRGAGRRAVCASCRREGGRRGRPYRFAWRAWS